MGGGLGVRLVCMERMGDSVGKWPTQSSSSRHGLWSSRGPVTEYHSIFLKSGFCGSWVAFQEGKFFFFFAFVFQNKVVLCNSGCPGTCSVGQPVLELRHLSACAEKKDMPHLQHSARKKNYNE